jgi:spermidine synthase
MYIQIILIGTLVGLEIPLLTRIIEDNAKNLRVTLSSIFSFDYIGGLIGSIAFPLILLPKFGYFATAFLTGTLNIIISIIIILKYKNYIKNINLFKISAVLALLLMLLGTIFSENIANNIESKLYRDKIIIKEQTPYQNIVVTKHKDDLRLFINGNIQFSSSDEYRYHESLVHVPMSVSKSKSKILILGGGDGLAVREVLKYEDVENITLVDLDEDMVELCRNNKNIVDINKGALTSSKLNVVYNDAFKYLQDSNDLFDVILIDLPDPNDENLNKLYTNVFYRLVGSHLNEGGIISYSQLVHIMLKKLFGVLIKH